MSSLGFTVPLTSFDVPLEIVVLGLITGLTYSLLGIGLTLTYKSTRVLNFAFGETGAISSTVLALLVLNADAPYWFALVAALVVGPAIGALTEVLVIRRLGQSSRLIVLVATIGIAQVLVALGTFLPRLNASGGSKYPVPFDATVKVGSLVLGSGQLIILVAAPIVAACIAGFLRYTRVGIGSRAAAENLEAAQLVGMPTNRVSLAIWTLAGFLAALAAILIGPTRPIVTAGYNTEIAIGAGLMLRALAPAMIGGLQNLPRVFVGGLLLGVTEALVIWNYSIGGLIDLIVLAAIMVVLFTQKGLSGTGRRAEESSWSLAGKVSRLDPAVARLPSVRTLRRAGVALALLVAGVLPLMLDTGGQVKATVVVIHAMAALSLVVLTGYGGMVSLGQFAFVGLGAITAGKVLSMGFPHWMALLYAMGAGALAALVVGLPALRVRGLFLAVTTLAFAVAASQWLFTRPWLARDGSGASVLTIPRFRWLGIDFQSERNYYWLCLVVLILLVVALNEFRQSGAARTLMAVRDNEAFAATLSVPPRRVKLYAFVASGVIASGAGFFYGGLLVNFPDSALFSPARSLELMTLAIVGNVTMITGVIQAAIFIRGVPPILEPIIGDLAGPKFQLLLSGAAVVVVILQYPGGLVEWALEARNAVVKRVTGRNPVASVDDVPERTPRMSLPPAAELPDEGPAPLVAEDIVVRYGGNVAVDGVSLEVGHGQIVGLLGPNGAGKTTLFDVLSGQLKATSGRVLLFGEDVTADRPERLAIAGLGRSFQEARLFTGLTLRDVFKVSLEREARSEWVPAWFGAPPSRDAEANKDLRADELLDLLGLGPFSHRLIGELSTGMRRITELGCLIGMGAEVLLLDEPTAGIAQREVEAFAQLLREIKRYLGATLVLIDHDVPLVLGLADHVYVLAAGEVIASAPPAAIRDDPRVIAAFLGTDQRTIHRSGQTIRSRTKTGARTAR